MEPVRHRCMIYDGSPARHLPGIAATIADRLQANARCMYLNSRPMVAGIRSYLSAAGVDVAAEVSRGALILSSEHDHLVEGRFDIDKMLGLLNDALDQALADGYDTLFAVGDMTWEFGPQKNFEKLCEYEQRLEEVFLARPQLTGICQYHLQTLPEGVAEEALRHHRGCYINHTLSLLNREFVEPGLQSNSNISADHRHSMMAQAGVSVN